MSDTAPVTARPTFVPTVTGNASRTARVGGTSNGRAIRLQAEKLGGYAGNVGSVRRDATVAGDGNGGTVTVSGMFPAIIVKLNPERRSFVRFEKHLDHCGLDWEVCERGYMSDHDVPTAYLVWSGAENAYDRLMKAARDSTVDGWQLPDSSIRVPMGEGKDRETHAYCPPTTDGAKRTVRYGRTPTAGKRVIEYLELNPEAKRAEQSREPGRVTVELRPEDFRPKPPTKPPAEGLRPSAPKPADAPPVMVAHSVPSPAVRRTARAAVEARRAQPTRPIPATHIPTGDRFANTRARILATARIRDAIHRDMTGAILRIMSAD